eukprot:768564-Hanusia_phi.AAC.7
MSAIGLNKEYCCNQKYSTCPSLGLSKIPSKHKLAVELTGINVIPRCHSSNCMGYRFFCLYSEYFLQAKYPPPIVLIINPTACMLSTYTPVTWVGARWGRGKLWKRHQRMGKGGIDGKEGAWEKREKLRSHQP